MLSLGKSINQHKSFLILGLVTLGSFAAINPAQAVTFESKAWTTDTEFISLVNRKEFEELFVAEGRVGDSGGMAQKEVKINGDVVLGAPVLDEKNFNWGNSGTLWDFTLAYTGSEVKFTVGNTLISTTKVAANSEIGDIFIRTAAVKNSNTTDSIMTLSNLLFNGQAITNSSGVSSISSIGSTGTSNGRDIDYLQIKDVSSTKFTITGKTSMSWTGTRPSNSNLAFQIKVGKKKSVPEPGMVAAILAVGIVGATVSRRKQVVI
ncbi:MAG: PEP-CTERM sorting domain-containing protein [Desmonostoc vinosum HA7617-LM4]|jgi:hypothetical protein|nr:PEP-CTERM sorting domain-containing protein [Desmonostoc vinosum HA7617-LM4]